MPLQNRVDPFGQIHAVTERGLFTGNRGIIHDPDTKTLLRKRWTLQAWIICRCRFKDVRREPMGRNRIGRPGKPDRAGWTELFFLDEVTALAAGHRPCFYCRREQARDFIDRFGQAFNLDEPRAPMLDGRLHRERLASGSMPTAITARSLAALPDAAMFADGTNAYAIHTGKALRWSFAGYGGPDDFSLFDDRRLLLLTPPTTVAVLRQGFSPVWHSTAGS